MCGYFVSNDPFITNSHEKLIENLLRFRGPDSSSGLIHKNGWKFYHSRLAIIDLKSERSNQPFVDKNDGVLVFNGEILNYKTLALKYFGLEYKSDTELLSELIINDRLDLNELDGFFSFCYVDGNANLRYVARDQFGVKPLFYYKRENYITICSEPSVIKEIFSLSVNKNAVEEYYSLRAPIFQGSFFVSIESLPPGKCLINGTYFDVSNELNGEYKNVCFDSLSSAIDKGVSSRLISDAKVGLLLSRGIDSNLIRSRYNFENLYTIGFDGDEDLKYLESLNLTNLKIKKSSNIEYKERFEKLLELRKEPLSVPNETLLSKIGTIANNDGVKVLLSGEGADEFFGGYDRIFQWAARKRKFDLEEFLALYSYGPIKKDSNLYQIFENIFRTVSLPNVFEYVRWFFIRYHMPVLFRRLDFSLMYAGVEGREPLANIHLFNEAKKMGPEQLMGNLLGKLPLRKLSSAIYGEQFAYEKKVGFPVDIKNIYQDTSNLSSYEIWFKNNGEILK